MITAVVMAGGKSRRMGQPKLLLEHRGKTLLANAIQRASCVTNQVLTVVGAYGDLYRREAECSGAIVVENPNWTEGLSSSLRTAVRNLEPEVEAILVILPDQPFVPTSHLRSLLKTHKKNGAPLVLSCYQGVRGAPAVIARPYFSALLELRGENGAKSLDRREKPVTAVKLENGWDVDTMEDAKLLQDYET